MNYSIIYYRYEVLGYVAKLLGGFVARWSPYPSTCRLPPWHPTGVTADPSQLGGQWQAGASELRIIVSRWEIQEAFF